MAGVSTEQGSGSLNVELNLVPFIDLLSTLVLFLLVTAVWTQVSAISASVNAKGKSATVQMDSQKVQVRVTNGGYRITWPRAFGGRLPSVVPAKSEKLELVMKKAALLEKGSPFPITALSGDDNVPYEDVVQALDAIKSAGIRSVGLSTE